MTLPNEIAISAEREVSDRVELEAAVREYLDRTLADLKGHAGIELSLDATLSATMRNLPAYLPPRGGLFLARGPEGELLGTAFLKMIRKDTAEIKRLYVRPAARGSGLGRRLTVAAIDGAKDRGANRILIDTGVWMKAARRLYEDLGFRYIEPYPESENPAEMSPFLVYMELAL
ncbi:MAG: GNAT family N-acetyltransferase [Pseudomonadota bacterium]